MVDGGDGEDKVKIIAGTIKFLNGGGQDACLRQIKLVCHGAECTMAVAGVISAFRQWFQAYNVAGAMYGRPQAEHAFAAADLQQGLIRSEERRVGKECRS